MRGNVKKTLQSGTNPILANTAQNFARGVAITKSQHKCQTEAAAVSRPVDGGDCRDLDCAQGLQPLVQAIQSLPVVVGWWCFACSARTHRLDVSTGAENAVTAGQNQDIDIIARFDLTQQRGNLVSKILSERIALLWPRHRQYGDAVINFKRQSGLHIHFDWRRFIHGQLLSETGSRPFHSHNHD